MDNAFRMLSDLVSNLTSVIVGILGLGIVGSLAFGDMMGLDVGTRCNWKYYFFSRDSSI